MIPNLTSAIFKFIYPHGKVVGLGNSEDKYKGYKDIFNDHNVKYDGKEMNIELFFYNESTGVNESVKGYFIKDFIKIFK